jgi:hypothetical protein
VRRIVFVKYYDKGSTRFCGDQVAAFLRARGLDALSIPVAELPRHPRSIAVFIKTSRVDHLVRARMAGTTCVLDLQDTPCFKRRIKNARLFHGCIFRTERQRRDFTRAFHRSAYIPQHWDLRYAPHEAGESELRAGFMGDPRSLPFEDLPGVEIALEEDEWFALGRRVNCHVSARRPGREWAYKPNTKVSTAAACGAALVTTRDDCALEMLGDDYPYFTRDASRDAMLEALDHARRTIGGEPWRVALSKLARVKELTRPERITQLYVDYLSSLDSTTRV